MSGCGRVEFGVRNTCVVNGFEAFEHYSLSLRDVAEGDGAVVEVPFAYLTVDKAIDKGRDALFGVFGKRS